MFRKELEEMSEMRRHTNQLLQNLLPLHVAKFFLAEERISEDLFAEARSVNRWNHREVLAYHQPKTLDTVPEDLFVESNSVREKPFGKDPIPSL